MENIRAFKELTGWIFGRLYACHPVGVTLDPSDVPRDLRELMEKTSTKPRAFQDFWRWNVNWLEQEGSGASEFTAAFLHTVG